MDFEHKHSDIDVMTIEVPSALSMDLSSDSMDESVFTAFEACELVGYRLLYTETSSADAGVAVRIGKLEQDGTFDNDYFDAVTSEVSKTAGYAKEYELSDLSHSLIAAGETVTVGNAGGKTGDGEVKITLFIKKTGG